MIACLQMDDNRTRRRQPYVLHVHHLLAVNLQMVAACHLLTDVQQQGIVALLGNT